MTMRLLRKTLRYGSAAIALAGLLGAVGIASAGAENKKAAPAKAAPAARPAARPASRPAGGGAGGGARGASTGGAASHGPTANGASHGPTANGGGARTTTTTNSRSTTTTGSRSMTTAGGRPGTAGSTGMHPGGGHPTAIRSGPAPRGSNERVTRNGSAVRTRPNGRVSDIHDARRGMDVHHGLAGGRRVSVERADHSRVFAERGRRGFVERPYSYRGHDFARRSYYYHGRAYDRYYRGYGYRGVYLKYTRRGSTTRPPFTVGLITHGRCRSPSDGVGPAIPGMDTMAAFSLPIRCTPRPRSG